jgi:hypothetical protein
MHLRIGVLGLHRHPKPNRIEELAVSVQHNDAVTIFLGTFRHSS